MAMDDVRIITGGWPRRYPREPQTGIVGYVRAKRRRLQRHFAYCSFSIILDGEGTYTRDERSYHVRAPCVLTQEPGPLYDYGPDGRWEELYIVYPPEQQELLQRRGYLRADRPMWNVDPRLPLRGMVGELYDLLHQVHLGHVDEVDCLADLLILRTLMAPQNVGRDTTGHIVRSIQAHVAAHFTEQFRWDEIAVDHALSPSTFRRHWAEIVGIPPSKYLAHLRMQQACRLLTESNMLVGQIARAVGYSDELYFSRRFREVTGFPPTEYREKHEEMS